MIEDRSRDTKCSSFKGVYHIWKIAFNDLSMNKHLGGFLGGSWGVLHKFYSFIVLREELGKIISLD